MIKTKNCKSEIITEILKKHEKVFSAYKKMSNNTRGFLCTKIPIDIITCDICPYLNNGCYEALFNDCLSFEKLNAWKELK